MIMSLNLNRYIQIFCLIFLFLFSSNTISNEKLITYKCTGLSEFELIGSSGLKEEVKIKEYIFEDGMLLDLNNIKCDWVNNNIKCESNFLNVRKLNINLNNNEVSDYISGNKGFGVYIETFKGKCEQKK
tara:strand:+ start:971 stop:1357 length:387 start_codon:yes stop_codon:yes gene_type:complete